MTAASTDFVPVLRRFPVMNSNIRTREQPGFFAQTNYAFFAVNATDSYL
jgi:hypothetical protein